ncbi:MAG: hypothetical protein LAT67_04315 [Balneolales bacterium]|nr:hypothetical protein [Balneolales bacterium]
MKQQDSAKKINFLDLLIVIAKSKFFIIKTVFAVTLIALVVSLLWPTTFKSNSTVIPVQQQQTGLGGLAGLANNLLPLSFSSPGLNTESLALILSTRTVRERVIEEFDLMEVYGHSVIEQTFRTLDSNTDITLVREGGFGFNPITAIQVSVTDRDPQRAQAMTAFYISYLDSVATTLNTANARNRFEVIKRRYQQNLAELEEAELALKAFQQEFGIIDIEQQSSVLIQSLAAVVSQKIELDIEINLLQSRVSADNPELRSLLQTRRELERVISDLTVRTDGETGMQFLPAFDDVPDLGLRYVRLYRDVVVQNKIYETIFPQFVQQQMLVETPSQNMQIIDPADLPTYKDGPKRAFIVLGGFMFSLIISLTIVLLRDFFEEKDGEQDDDYRRLMELKKHALSWKK